jgi:hypothetical protein
MQNNNEKNDVRAMEKMGREGEAAVLILPSSEMKQTEPARNVILHWPCHAQIPPSATNKTIGKNAMKK